MAVKLLTLAFHTLFFMDLIFAAAATPVWTTLNRGSNITATLPARAAATPVTKPWCLWELNFVTYSFAMIVPFDGSATTDGLDKAGQCGRVIAPFAMAAKGVATTEWKCHYGPEQSACVTFNTALLPHAANDVASAYEKLVKKAVKCDKPPEDGNAVCPRIFGRGD